MNPDGVGPWVAFGVAALVGGGVAGLWIRTLSRWVPLRALGYHLAAGPFMVMGTVPAWMAFTSWMGSAPADGVPGMRWDVLLPLAVGGVLWLAGLRCLVEGHRVLRNRSQGGGPV